MIMIFISRLYFMRGKRKNLTIILTLRNLGLDL
jgi:hypothetical protein